MTSGGTMVRFTVRDCRDDSSIRMEMESGEMLDAVRETAEEYWGRGRVMLVRDYRLLDPGTSIGDSVDEGDVIDVIPYIRGDGWKRWRRLIILERIPVPWSEGSVPARTSSSRRRSWEGYSRRPIPC